MDIETIKKFIPDRQLLLSWQRALIETTEAVYYNHKIPLRTPFIRISNSRNHLGEWDRETRTIFISKFLLLGYPYDNVVEVLKHELAHMVVEEHYKVVFETPHGPSFRDACRKLGISSVATNKDNEAGVKVDSKASRLVSKVKKLLALSGSMNIHEAEVAMQKANALLTRYNLSLHDHEEAREEEYSYRQIGNTKARHAISEMLIANILTDFFFVESIFVPYYDAFHDKHGTILEILGRLENIMVSDFVYNFLIQQSEILWQQYKRKLQLKGSREKRSYLYGMLQGFRGKLEKQTKSAAKDLIWVGAKPLQCFLKFRHPRIHRSATGGSPIWRGAYMHGQKDGERLTMHKPIHHRSRNDGNYQLAISNYQLKKN